MREIYKNQSLWGKFVNFSLIFMNDDVSSSSIEKTKKYIERNSNNKVNKNIFKFFLEEKIDDLSVLSYNGTLDNTTGVVLLYIHGGNFVQKMNKFQVKFATDIANKLNATLIVPFYELLPSGNYKKMNLFLDKIFKRIESNNPSKLIFMGDSAGGGTVLSYAMQLRDKKLLQPSNIILFSPWLDLSMTNPDIYVDEKNDRLNSVAGVKYEGELWADGDDVLNPLISPMYGKFNGLGHISLVFGGKGIFSSECKKFDKLLSEQNIEHDYLFFEHEGHDFILFPTKESKIAINKIVNIVNSHL